VNLHYLYLSQMKTRVVTIYYCITTWEKLNDHFKFVFREPCLLKIKPDWTLWIVHIHTPFPICKWTNITSFMVNIYIYICLYSNAQHRWCNGWHASLECGRSSVRIPVGSNQKLKQIVFCLFFAKRVSVISKNNDLLDPEVYWWTIVFVS
jgi:hypothetical protein